MMWSKLHIRHFFLILSFLGTLCTRVGVSVSQDHAYIPTEDNLLYLVEDMVVPIKREETFSKDSSESWKDEVGSVTVLGSPIGFEPGELDFGEQPIGVPVLRKVRIHNLNAESSIQMLSISGNTVHFHCSFFAAKVIPPLGNTTFDVVFLSREAKDLLENTLYVHTSAGSFRFNVKASGGGDPYGLSPLTGIKLPLNTTYNRSISITNPSAEPIQVLEMISSGSADLSLVSPDGDTEVPEAAWTIPPFTTKVLMLAKFFARKEKNYTAYIRIRTNASLPGGKFLYVPFEALVFEPSAAGVFAPNTLLDFGTFVLGGVKEKPSSRDCLLYSTSLKKSLPLKLNRFGENIEPSSLASTFPLASPHLHSIASLTFRPSTEGLFEGFVEMTSSDKLTKAIWKYRAFVLNGSLAYEANSTSFYVGRYNSFIRKKFSLRNDFKVPVMISGVQKLSASSVFDISDFQPIVLAPGEEKNVLVITYNVSAPAEEMLVQESTISILTDVYNLNVTFRVYDGKIKKVLPDSPSRDYLDFGSLGMAVTRESSFILSNPNPVNVTILKLDSNCSGCSLDCSRELNKFIPPGESIPFCLRVTTSESEGSVLCQISIQTQYESLRIPVRYRVVRGSLTTVPEDLEFAPVFPGEKAELKLTVYSSFAQEMITNDVVTVPKDESFSFQHGVVRGRNVIMSVEKSYIGKVIFDPAMSCRKAESCYVGFEMESDLGQFWLSAHNASSRAEIMDITEMIVKILRQRYLFFFQQPPFLSAEEEEETPSLTNNVTLSLNTNQIRGFLFRARTRMYWPTVVQEEKIDFSYTQIGNATLRTCSLRNPSSVYPLHVHLLMINHDNSSPFQILSVESNTQEPLQGLGPAKSFILPPSSAVRVKLKFSPSRVFPHADNLLVRNNLTGGEVVWLRGNGSTPSFRLGLWHVTGKNVQGLSGNLGFEIKEKDLSACVGKPPEAEVSQVLTVRDSFKARNTGDVPIWILGFSIGEYPCEGYGFKVLGCVPFRLDPHSARDIEIAFTPDFTLSYVEQTLHIASTLDPRPLNYTLSASIPPKMLAPCAALLPRPMWEAWIYYILNLGLLLVFLGVCLASRLESNCLWSIFESSTNAFLLAAQNFVPPPPPAAELPEEFPPTREGLRQRRVNRRRSSADKEDDGIGLKGHLSSLLDMVVPRPEEPAAKVSPSPKTTQNNAKVSKKKQTQKPSKGKKALDEAESSSTTTESSNVEELTEISPIKPAAAEVPSQKSDLKAKAKNNNSTKKSGSSKKPSSVVVPGSSEPDNLLDFSVPISKKTRPGKKPSEEPKASKPKESAARESPSPQTTPPAQQKKKMQAKVKPCEAPKNGGRNASPPTTAIFDKPPRMLPKNTEKNNSPGVGTKKVPPVGKILPEIKQPSGSQYGPIGAPRRPEPPKHGDQGEGGILMGSEGLGLGSADTFGVPPPPRALSSSSLMQSLQAERRQRTEEFLLKNRRPVDWPGFDNNNLQNNNLLESLWDRPEEYSDVWGGSRGSGLGGTTGIWSNNFWGPQQEGGGGPYYNGRNSLYPQQQQSQPQQQMVVDVKEQPPYEASGRSSNNYYHLSSIWSGNEEENRAGAEPPANSSSRGETTTWSSTLFATNQI